MLRKMPSVCALGLLCAGALGLTGCSYHDHHHHHERYDRKLYRYERCQHHGYQDHHHERHYHGHRHARWGGY